MIFIHEVSLHNSLGNRPGEILANLAAGRAPGLREDAGRLVGGKSAVFAHMAHGLPAMPAGLERHASRNSRALAGCWEGGEAFPALLAASDPRRVAVVMGTSTSGSEEAAEYVEAAVKGEPLPRFDGRSQELGDPSDFLADWLGIRGPAYTVSTACTSSARALVSAARLIDAGMADAALAGGADTLARMPANGFASLSALSLALCRPFEAGRCGITIGEGAGLMWLSQERSDIALLGWGETSDGYHVSSPDPRGEGAAGAMRRALERAGLAASDIAYVNLHGTGTRLNDEMEAKAVNAVFGPRTPCSSTKSLTGHTLGAAGVTEAGLLALLLRFGGTLPAQFAPGASPDPALDACGLLREPLALPRAPVMSCNFAFGGSNIALILGPSDD